MIVVTTMKHFSQEVKDEVIRLRLACFSLKKISEQTGIGLNTVIKWTKGITPSGPTHPLYLTAKVKHDYFSNENLKLFPERFVMIGFIAADGCISDTEAGQKRLVFNLCKKDKSILDIFNQEICDSTRNLSENKKTNSVSFYISSNSICEDLSKFGIVPRKTATYQFPKLDSLEMKYFIRGYFYGDGCCYQNGRMSMYHLVGNANFLLDLKNYLLSHEIIETCAIHAIKNHDGYQQMHIKGRYQTSKFAKYLFDDEKMKLLPRKHVLLGE